MRLIVQLLFACFLCLGPGAMAQGLLDGRVFSGLIGPREDPDLDDSLHFHDGHFWSDIGTRCGFAPGPYRAKTVAGGIAFSGILESESRGRFSYEGLVGDDGRITVSILWEKRRWYWTSRRDIAFVGQQKLKPDPLSLDELLARMATMNMDEHPLCARF